MTASTFYCPVSARINRGEQPLLSPPDAAPRRLDPSERSVEIAADRGLLQMARLVDASDALFDAYDQDGRTWLVSRSAFDVADLQLIADDLLRASSHREVTGVISSSVTEDGYLFVLVDYRPVQEQVRSADNVRELFGELRRAHGKSVFHGGINERFINPGAPEGRRVFGFGLAEAYAAWRRNQGLALGDIVADPRFASTDALRGETPDARQDRFALAAVCLTELAGDQEGLPTLEPVQGLSSFLGRAGSVGNFSRALDSVGDAKIEKVLESALLCDESAERPIWLLPIAAALGLILMLQIFGFFRSPQSEVAPPAGASSETESVICAGPGVMRDGNECRVAENTGRCADGTRFNASRGDCVAVSRPAPSTVDTSADTEDLREPEVASPYIHPVLECAPNQSKLSYKFSFSNDDINLTLGEKGSLARLAERCQGEASIVYYTSSPGLEDRARTIFSEFRSSSVCGEECQRVMPEQPTSVIFVPNIDMLDRANEHYMFFQCCED